MPEKKKKPRKSKEKALADRVYKHYKAIKRNWTTDFVPTRKCENCVWSTWPHWHGYRKMVTPNEDWMLLARTHGISVREVKDIATARRKWTRKEAIERHEYTAELMEKIGLDHPEDV